MKLASLLSPGLMRSSLRRYWPLWLVGFVALVLLFDIPLYSLTIEVVRSTAEPLAKEGQLEELWNLLQACVVPCALVFATVVAIALNDHLFDSRTAIFVGSLPIRRPVVFASVTCAGALMLVAIDALATLCLLPLCAIAGPLVTPGALVSWFALLALLSLVSYAFATLACHLSGTRPVALLLCLVIDGLVVCLEAAVRLAITALMYGLSFGEIRLDWASPAVWLMNLALRWGHRSVFVSGGSLTPYALSVGCYLVASCAAVVLAGWLFCRRDLEKAGDSVSFDPLYPALSLLAGVSMALLFGSVFRLTRLASALNELPMTGGEAAMMALLMAVGGMLGILFAQMIMRRSTHVLDRCWRSGLVLAAVSFAFVGACRFDVLGVQHRVPQASEVERVGVTSGFDSEMVLASPEAIEEVCQLHRDIIAYDCAGSVQDPVFVIGLTYHLKGGRTLTRSYPILTSALYSSDDLYEQVRAETASEVTRLVDRYATLADSPEGRASRYARILEGDKAKLNVQVEGYLSAGSYSSVSLTKAERASLIDEALRKDLMEETVGMVLEHGAWAEEGYDASITVEIPIDEGYGGTETLLNMQLDETRCPHTVAWVREHRPDIELVPWPGGNA